MEIMKSLSKEELEQIGYFVNHIWANAKKRYAEDGQFFILEWKDGTPEEVKRRAATYTYVTVKAK